MTTRTRSRSRKALLLGVILAALPRLASAADAPAAAPAPTTTLALSDKPPSGCCCISTNDGSNKKGCTYGLSEDACRSAAKAVATWSASWTPGKCPAR